MRTSLQFEKAGDEGSIISFRNTSRPVSQNRGSINSENDGDVISITPFPFAALKMFDVFCFDAGVREYAHNPDTDEFNRVQTSVRYVVTGRNLRHWPNGSIYEVSEITTLESVRRKADLYFYSFNPKWGLDGGLDLQVMRLGNFLGVTDTSNIPQRGDFLRSSKGTLCPKGKIESLQAIRDRELPGGIGIRVSSPYKRYHLLPHDNFAMPHALSEASRTKAKILHFPKP